MKEIKRCRWPGQDELYVRYHDEEWGRPCREDRKLFEMLLLEGAQAGLSWITILRKRENYREAFDGFDPELIATYGDEKVEELLGNLGIVRNRLKVRAFITNAQAYLRVVQEFGDFSTYIWSFTDGQAINFDRPDLKSVPATSSASDAMSRDLKKRGFKFVGSTICYAFMQACGMVDDHVNDCAFKTGGVLTPGQ